MNPPDKFAFIDAGLEMRRSQNLWRELRPLKPLTPATVDMQGRTLVNFSSNDYLGLAGHPLLRQRADAFMERYGAGSTASRLICGTYDCFPALESKLAGLKGTETALIMNSGFQANISVLPALTDRDSLILSDQLNHSSIVHGTLLSRCRVERFYHNDLAHLKQLLKKSREQPPSRTLIVTESIFSVDGDRSDLDGLIALAQEFNAILVVDEAHATGVFGENGMGLTCGKPVDIVIGTFGKACGSYGAYMAGPQKIRDYLINCCAGFIFTTALPPPVLGAIDAALDLIPEMEPERRSLQQKARDLRAALQALGYDTGKSSTQIIPVIIGDEKETLALSDWLKNRGLLGTALRPPTVEPGRSRIRLALSAAHSAEQIEDLVRAMQEWREEVPKCFFDPEKRRIKKTCIPAKAPE